MKPKMFRIAADIPKAVRGSLLRIFAPVHPIVMCQSITWAYKVPDGYAFPQEDVQIAVTGRYVTEDTESLLVMVNDRVSRVGSRILHITHSLRHGVVPKRAGEIDLDKIQPVQTTTFTARFQQFPMWERLKVAA